MQRIKGRMLFAIVAFGLAILRTPAPVVAAEKPAKLRTAYVSPIGAMAPVWMAAASSAFQTEGVDVELVYIQSSAAIAALVAGDIQVGLGIFPACRSSQPGIAILHGRRSSTIE